MEIPMDRDDIDDSSSGSSWRGAEEATSSSHSLPTSTTNDADFSENRYFGQSENRKVRNLKVLVFLVLFLVTLAVCLVIYFLTSEGQQDEFEAS